MKTIAGLLLCLALPAVSLAQHGAHSGHAGHGAAPGAAQAAGQAAAGQAAAGQAAAGQAAAGQSAAGQSAAAAGSQYAGQQSREIKSLSAEDIAELRRGGGWGLAKAAELNGVPGPAHLLELADEIPLDAGQREAIGRIYQTMRTEAIAEGERLIALERELERQFRERVITDAELRRLLGEIADSRAALRYVHLSTHLKTPELLSEAQIARYNALRGYGAADPCANVPAGHDPAMWRRHNNCE